MPKNTLCFSTGGANTFGGRPFIFEYKAPPGTWRTNAEHDARAAIIRAGLRPWVHIETLEG